MYNAEMRLMQIEQEIKKEESTKNTGTVLIIISFFCLWPLAIVGFIMCINASKKINALNEEKNQIMFMTYCNGTPNKDW